jgi:transposase
MNKQLTSAQKKEIIDKYIQGTSIRQISNEMSIKRTTVWNNIQKYKKQGNVERIPNSGRKKILNKEDIKIIENEIEMSPKVSLNFIAKKLAEKTGKFPVKQTIKNYINKLGYESHIACKKPSLTAKNVEKRIELCRNYILWPLEKWETVIFSDECKFNLVRSGERTLVWRKSGTRLENKNIVHTVKHGGGGLMVWACFSSKGVGNLVFIDGIMDQYMYCRILSENLFSSAKKMGLNSFIFQQDNDPKHESKLLKEFFLNNSIQKMVWPSQSPDLNPIENLWAYMKNELKKKSSKNLHELKSHITDIWNNLSVELLIKFSNSMPKRMELVLRNKGKSINF